jgi:hypothetical protein
MADVLIPDWPAPANVRAWQTLRSGGCSASPWQSFNLGDHVGDDPEHVTSNRRKLTELLPAEPVWLRQVHGNLAVNAAESAKNTEADAAYARRSDLVCVVMTADCLPVLFCDRAGTVVAAAHAGWRGLLGGVLENTLAAMQVPPGQVMAWLGPAIGPKNFEVGNEVYQAFVAQDSRSSGFFVSRPGGKWLADLYGLARLRLATAGVAAVFGGGFCTVSDTGRFFSYRRDGVTGRMASLIWLG